MRPHARSTNIISLLVAACLVGLLGAPAISWAEESRGPITPIPRLPYSIQKGTESQCGGVETQKGDIGGILNRLQSAGGDVGTWAKTASDFFPPHTVGANCAPICAKIPKQAQIKGVRRYWTDSWSMSNNAPLDQWAQYSDAALGVSGPGPGYHQWDREVSRVEISYTESLVCTLFRNWITDRDRAAQIIVDY